MVIEALSSADELDRHIAQTGELVGPLHGLPISVKVRRRPPLYDRRSLLPQEHIQLKGKICHAGFVSKIHNVAAEDAFLVKQLRKAGAIIHVRTNEPQSMMVPLLIAVLSQYWMLTNVIAPRL
jgi:amidase